MQLLAGLFFRRAGGLSEASPGRRDGGPVGFLLERVGGAVQLSRSLSKRRGPERAGPQASFVRSVQRHRRGADDLSPRGDWKLPELGLPLLLAAGRVVHGAGLFPTWLHGGAGRFRSVADACDPADSARAQGGLRYLWPDHASPKRR